MNEPTLSPEIHHNEIVTDAGISFGKAAIILSIVALLFVTVASWIGYQFFWEKPVFKDKKDFELNAAVSNVKSYPGNAALRVELGWNYMQQGDFVQAEKEFKNALKLDEANIGAKINLAILYGEKGDFKKSQTLLNEVIKKHPAQPDARLALGQLQLSTGDYDKAIEHFTFLLNMQPGTVDYMFLIGKAYEGKGDQKKAIELYEKVLTYVPDYTQAIEALRNIKATGDDKNGS